MQAPTQEPRRVENTTSGSSLTLNSPWTRLMRFGLRVHVDHVSFPTTASIAALTVLVVNGLAMKLLSPILRPRSISDLSGLPVTRMKPILAGRLELAQRLQQPEPVEAGHVHVGDDEMHGLRHQRAERLLAVLGEREIGDADFRERLR